MRLSGPWLRYYQAFRSIAAGDEWFLKTHGPEAARQPGLLRLACHEAALPERKGENGEWVRVRMASTLIGTTPDADFLK